MSFSFSSPAHLNSQIAGEISAGALAISGGNQTAILANLPSDAIWPTLTQLESAENLVRSLYDAAMNTARASGLNATVASTAALWESLCGFQNMFDVARRTIIVVAVPLTN
jgi:hypothetical protein